MNNNVKSLLFKTLKKNKLLCTALIAVVVLVVALSLVPPQILKIVVDKNLIPKDNNGLLMFAFTYAGVILFIGVFDFLKEGILTVLGQKITKDIRLEMIKKLERLNAAYFSGNNTGAVVSRLTNDVDAINSLFTNGIIGIFVDLFKIIGIVVSILIFSYKLALFTLLAIPFIYFLTRLIQKKTLSAQIKNRAILATVNNHISETLKNFEMIKAFGKEDYFENCFKESLEENFKTVEKVTFYDSSFPPVIQFARGLIIAVVVALSASSLNFLGITAGALAASIELISSLFSPVETLGMELQSIQQAVSGVKRVNGYLAEKEDKEKRADITAEDIVNGKEGITIKFDGVSFSYDKRTMVLDGINLTFKSGQKITFTGRTGVGKTTLFKLIMGLLKPDKGSITINGVDVYDIPNGEKRKIFGYVGQDLHIVSGTILEQVSLYDKNITRNQVKAALETAGLSEYIKTLKNGLDTVIENDNFFSQGQKQLLAVARAIVTNPPILLLDEVTANLDSVTEEKVISVLRKVGDNSTVFSISHRLTAMVSADTVVLLEKGRVKNSGTPQELMQNDDWYRSRIAMEQLTWK